MDRQELLRVFVLANEFKEGDEAVGGTRDDYVRREARDALAALRLGDLNQAAFVDDGVSEALARSLDAELAHQLAPLTIGELKRQLLATNGPAFAYHYSAGLTSEAIAAVVKLMSNTELSALSRKLFNPLPGRGVSVGSPAHFGSRIQPNSPGDDPEEILISILEGLACGCGDVIIGLNPASDDLETIIRLEELLGSVVDRLRLPTRYCVLSDMVKQTSARARAKVDVGFQSLAGTSRALTGMVGLGVDGLCDLARGFDGLYFETGQGSAVTNNAAEGVDMVTLESRAYGLARHLRGQTGAWMIVNDVAGFIGPEVFRTEEQLLRACLEDMAMAKLHGLTMGLDVCATYHMGISPAALERLTAQVVERAAPAYLMAVAGNTDPMLGYMTTSFREHPRLRAATNRQISTAMRERLEEVGAGGGSGPGAQKTAGLYAAYMRAGGDRRSLDTLKREGAKKVESLQARGFDLGYGSGNDLEAPPLVRARMNEIYGHARRALYATLDDAVLGEAAPRYIRVRTRSVNREDFLSHPPSGEAIRGEDEARIARLYTSTKPQVQVVISDGLNADAVNENLRAVLPPLRHELSSAGHRVGEVDIAVSNGRVRAGYHAGALLGVDVIVHLIGERPGTGLNMLSAYLTYGRDLRGESRWSADLDHSSTTAICGIHPRGKPPRRAAAEIARAVGRMLEERASGIALTSRIECR